MKITEPLGLEIVRTEITHLRAVTLTIAGYMGSDEDRAKFLNEVKKDFKETTEWIDWIKDLDKKKSKERI